MGRMEAMEAMGAMGAMGARLEAGRGRGSGAFDEAEAKRMIDELAALKRPALERVLRALQPPALRAIAEAWFWKGWQGQIEPEGDWKVWLLMAGRGFGKTRAGAEWVLARVRETPGARIALVGGNLREVESVMVRGPSGIIACAGTGERPQWKAGSRKLVFPCGAEAAAFSAERPDSLRGPEHHFAWCDELAKWSKADSTWDNLMFGLRAGAAPRALVTTTPRPVPLLRRIKAIEGLATTHGRMADNVSLDPATIAARIAAYGGTRLGRQELDGELIEDLEGSLWPRERIEKARGEPPERKRLVRVVVAVDPPASAQGACGISVCGTAQDKRLWVLADSSEQGLSPEGWAQAAARAYETWQADRVVAEANNGGAMVASVLRGAAPHLPVKLVHARSGKAKRAEPVAAAFERGEARFGGRFPALEDELAGLIWGGGYEGPGGSPDRADAMVWAMTELMAPERAIPRVLQL
jgi:phage terminase large subunit-like protein